MTKDEEYYAAEAYAAAQEQLHSSPEWKSAGRIVKHLWTIFVLLPVMLGILFAILR